MARSPDSRRAASSLALTGLAGWAQAQPAGVPGVKHDLEGSGFGFRTVRCFEAREVEVPHSCRIPRVE